MINGLNVTAVIVGRSGSRGVTGKNAMPIAGRPMIAHTIDDARLACHVDRILVSTDGQIIADAARNCGVEVVPRPAALATDTATVDSAVRHAIEESDDDAPLVVILYANVPVRPDDLIDRAIERLVSCGADSVQSYCDVGKHHPYWMMRVDDDHRVRQYLENRIYRRQDLPALVIPDGGVIAVRRSCLLTADAAHPHAFLGANRIAELTQPGDVVDVDHPADVVLAETILARHDNGASVVTSNIGADR